jgi:sulfur carrier protein ThiS
MASAGAWRASFTAAIWSERYAHSATECARAENRINGPGNEPLKAHTVLYRFTSSGKPDRSFGRGGMVALPASSGYESLALAVAPDGDVVLGQAHKQRIRLLVWLHGLVLGGMGTNANAVAVQTDGRIVIAGERDQEFVVARYMGGGTPRTCPGEHKSHKHKHRRKRRKRR